MTPRIDSLLSASQHGSRPALAYGKTRLTYRQLDQAAMRLAERLAPAIDPGGRIAVVAPNAPALVIAMLAVWSSGATVVPLSARLKEYELLHVMGDAQPGAFVSIESHSGYSFADIVPSLIDRIPSLQLAVIVDELGGIKHELTRASRAEHPDPLPAEMAALLYTSGTTGEPKGAMTTHASCIHGAHELASLLDLGLQDSSILIVPVSHAFGLVCLLATLASGGIAVLVGSSFSLEPLLTAIERDGATVLHGSPTLFASLLKVRPDGAERLRAGFVGGARCPPAVIEQLDRAGTRILNLFGMTEIGAAAACRPDDPPEARRTTVGRALPGYEFRVDGEPGGLGELQVRGPFVSEGYYGRPDLTEAAFDGEWFRTGDLGFIDDVGFITIAGRAKEVVHVAGFNVFPAEVEGFFLTHPAVERVAVVGVPREGAGEALRAFVMARDGFSLSPAELIRFARAGIAGYKIPYEIDLVYRSCLCSRLERLIVKLLHDP